MCMNICLSRSQSNLDMCQVSKRLLPLQQGHQGLYLRFSCAGVRALLCVYNQVVCKDSSDLNLSCVAIWVQVTRSFQRAATATPFWKDGCPFSFLAINMRIQAKQRDRYCKLEREGPCCRMLPSLLSCAFPCLHTPLVFLEESATIVAIASLLVLASVLDVFPWPWVLCCPRVHLLPSAGLLRGAPLRNCVVSIHPFNLFCYLSTWNASAPLYLYIVA